MASLAHPVSNPLWTLLVPPVALLLAVAALAGLYPAGGNAGAALVAVGVLGAAVFAAVHHAEVVAARVGEPFGSIILAVAVTVIEVGLILALMAGDNGNVSSVARDTVYAAVMIVLGGMVGICLVLGGSRHHEQTIQVHGTTSALAALAPLATMALILPNFTMAAAGPLYNTAQLAAVAVVSLSLWASFIFVQTIRHRDYFLVGGGDENDDAHGADEVPENRVAAASTALLCIALLAVVLLAKSLSPMLTALISAAHLPYTFTGVVIAALVLLPEGISAAKAALADRPQTSLNLALGSALASIGLTVPAVAVLSLWTGTNLMLGVTGEQMVLLVLAMFVSVLTLGTGRTTVLHGIVHLSVFAMFLLLSAVPYVLPET